MCDLHGVSVCWSGEEAVIMRGGTSRERSGAPELQTERRKEPEGRLERVRESVGRWNPEDTAGSRR